MIRFRFASPSSLSPHWKPSLSLVLLPPRPKLMWSHKSWRKEGERERQNSLVMINATIICIFLLDEGEEEEEVIFLGP